ncbi:hypothetical protein D9M68_950670 [compost metagenome]
MRRECDLARVLAVEKCTERLIHSTQVADVIHLDPPAFHKLGYGQFREYLCPFGTRRVGNGDDTRLGQIQSALELKEPLCGHTKDFL